jgi:citrate synthase
MLIGKAGEALSAISRADETTITVRGRDLCNDLMGRLSFTEFFLLHLLGRDPTEDQRFFLDAMLVGLAEHGPTPSVQAARMTLAAAPEALQGAVAAGILGAGSVVLGAAENAGRLIARGLAEAARTGEPTDAVARRLAQELRDKKQAIPGFGHPLHKPEDPRAVRLLALADARKVAGRHTAFLRALAPVVDAIWQRHLPINVNGAIAAIMLDLDFPLESLRGIPILARCAGLIGHLYEETQRPIGFLLAHHAEAAVRYDGD